MPKVVCKDGKTKLYPYTPEGRKAAKAYAKRYGCTVANTPKRENKYT